MLKIYIITQDEPFFIPKMIKFLEKNKNNVFEVKGITVLKPHRKNKTYFHWFKERANIYSWQELLISGLVFIFCKIYNLTSKNSPYSVKSYVKKFKYNEINTSDINDPKFISKLKKLNVDVVISISSPQIFGEALLKCAKYCINAHGTLLPRHRGVFGSWWTLYSGDEIAGSTIHTMELKLDAGEILWQKEFSIKPNDTQYSIAFKTKQDMAVGLVETLNNILANNINKIKPKYKSTYHRAPSKEQGKDFHKKGLRIIKLKDIKLILRQNF